MSALICAWMRVDHADLPAFLDFHTNEHLPERLAIPGFLRGRRFAAIGAPELLLVLYEVASLDVLTGAGYVERLNNPTAWTIRSMPLIRENRRLAVKLDVDQGTAGDVLAVTHIAAPTATLANDILADTPRLLAQPRVTSVRIGRVDDTASNLPTAERAALGAHPHAHGLLFCLESTTEAAAHAALGESPLSGASMQTFQLQTTCEPPL